MIQISKNKYTNDLLKYFTIKDYTDKVPNMELLKNILDDILIVSNTILLIKSKLSLSYLDSKHIENDIISIKSILNKYEKEYNCYDLKLHSNELYSDIFIYNFENLDDLEGFQEKLNNDLDYEIYTTLKKSKSDIIIEKLDEIKNLLNKNGI